MIFELDQFRLMGFAAVLLRLSLAMLFGGIIGLEGARKGRPAGFRTYMLVCVGATLAMLLGQYESAALAEYTLSPTQNSEINTDVARFGAQVINGVGFLGAGTIIVTGKHQVKGLTTAAGLWVSACTGLAIGAGFYECCVIAFVIVFFVVRILPGLEELLVRNTRNIIIYVEYDRIEHTGSILNKIRELGAKIYEVEIGKKDDTGRKTASAVFTVRLRKPTPHTEVLAHISQLEYVTAIEEV